MTDDEPDRRLSAYRSDLADAALDGRVRADRIAAGREMQVALPCASMRPRPDMAAGIDTQALFGEAFLIFEIANGWAWGRSRRDGYVGYLAAAALADRGPAPTHRVVAFATHVYPETGTPDAPATGMKLVPTMRLTFGATVSVVGAPVPLRGATGEAVPIFGGGYTYAAHLAPLGRTETDVAGVAERFLGVPYLWGGRSADGLDCSALVQIGVEATGRACPRDTDMQEGHVAGVAGVGQPVEGNALLRGDLVFWPGHVGIMLDEARLLHANAHHMAVAIEPLAETVARLATGGTFVTSMRRP